MAVKIKNVTLTPNSTTVGHSVDVSVEVTEGSWDSIKELKQTWNDVITTFTDWESLKNW